MGVLPLQYSDGENAESLGLERQRRRSTSSVSMELNDGRTPKTVKVKASSGDETSSSTRVVRIDTPSEASYYRNGGIMPYVLRDLLAG